MLTDAKRNRTERKWQTAPICEEKKESSGDLQVPVSMVHSYRPEGED